jgi:MFS family permease
LAAFTLAQLPGGWAADRFDRRRVMVACDCASALAALSLFAAAATDRFQLELLLAAGAVLGCGWATRGPAETASLPNVVQPDDLPAAAALMEGRAYAAGIAGPPLAGALFAVSPGLPFLVDGLSYAVAGGCAASVRRPLREPRPGRRAASPLREIRAGLRLFWRDRFIRTTAALDGATQFAVNGLGLAVMTMLMDAGAGASSIGVVLGAGSAGGVAGAMLAVAVTRRAGSARAVLVTAPLAAAACAASVALAGGAVAVAVAYAAFFLGQPAWAATLTAQRLTRVGDDHRGRVQSAAMLVASVPPAATPLAAGLLLSSVGVRTTCLVLAGVLVLVAAVAARVGSTSRSRLRALPDAVLEAPVRA